jgi:Protein of unknown function (DUF3465)
MHINKIGLVSFAACLLLPWLAAYCQPQNPNKIEFFAKGQEQVISAQAAHAIKVEVTVTAPVKKLLEEDDKGLPHQKFLLGLVNGSTILIAHDIAMANRVPVRAGDIVKIHGEYIWNSRGGLIHWTHHTDTPYHEGGWIEFQGVRYQ